MRKIKLCLAFILLFSAACSTPTSEFSPEPTPSLPPEPTVVVTTETEEAWPPVVGPDPSTRIAAFYYPWYFNQAFDGDWDHWGNNPPEDIDSDYYPVLGTYSMSDPTVLAQHFAWLRQAGIGLIISSWWGIGDPTDQALPLLLDIADHYGIKVAIHIEPYDGRSATQLLSAIDYLYEHYGDHPAFFKTTDTSCYSTGDQLKGLFFLWASVLPDGSSSSSVEPDYWRETLDTLHSHDPGAIVVTDQADGWWVTEGHFDGAYNYAVLDIDEVGYAWAAGMPRCSWYIPGINPGFSAIKINYEDWVNTPRRDGATYDDRWERMFAAGVEPAIVAITTFNEWHEGTQIEPAAPDMARPNGDPYLDFSPLEPEAYLDMTRQWVETFFNHEWPEGILLRVRVRTTSDWTDVTLISGAAWRAPDLVTASEEATLAALSGNHIALNQSLADAEAGNQVEITLEIEFMPGETQDPLIFSIERGHLGATWVDLYRFDGQVWVLAKSFWWSGIRPGSSNTAEFEVDHETIFGDIITEAD